MKAAGEMWRWWEGEQQANTERAEWVGEKEKMKERSWRERRHTDGGAKSPQTTTQLTHRTRLQA